MDTTEGVTDLMSVYQLQRHTGEAESTWRKRIGRRELPFIKLGANVRVRRTDLEAWLAARMVPAQERERV